MKLGPVVQGEMLFKEKVYGRTHDGRTKTDHSLPLRWAKKGDLNLYKVWECNTYKTGLMMLLYTSIIETLRVRRIRIKAA